MKKKSLLDDNSMKSDNALIYNKESSSFFRYDFACFFHGLAMNYN